MQVKKRKAVLLAGIIVAAVVFMLSMPFWATDAADARKTLEAFGFTTVQVGGFDSFGCGIDLYATRFVAKNAAGKAVKGDVCRTPGMKNSTIEIDNAE